MTEPKPLDQYLFTPARVRFLDFWHILAPGAEDPESEYRFHPQRRWRFDWAWPAQKVAVEYEGGIFGRRGAHGSVSGIMRDIEKYNAATLLGWRVFRCTVKMLEENPAGFIGMVKDALEERRSPMCCCADEAAGLRQEVARLEAVRGARRVFAMPRFAAARNTATPCPPSRPSGTPARFACCRGSDDTSWR